MNATRYCPQCGEKYDESVSFCAVDGTPLTVPPVSDLTGRLIGGRYRVISRIGGGGMGEVFLAEHVRMKRKSALKVIRPTLLSDQDALQRFTREAENASQISHPNVAAIFDFGETDDGVVYLAMEFVDGESLGSALARLHFYPPIVAADIIGQAAEALQAAHDMGILHRDIKPDNLMVSTRSDGTFVVKLVDFGIARSLEWRAQQVTRTGLAVGTPEFMSPEQISGDALDARSDQYSLALVAFQALTGRDAFGGAISKESLVARLTSRPQRLAIARKEVEWPPSLQDVFDKALAPDPSDRYDSVAEFGKALTASILTMPNTETGARYQQAIKRHNTPRTALTAFYEMPEPPQDLKGPVAASAKIGPRHGHRRRDPVRMGARRSWSPFRWLLLIVVFTYGVWWYGSRQPQGTALNKAATRIERTAVSAREYVVRLIARYRA